MTTPASAGSSLLQDMQQYSTGRMYLNFPGHGEGDNLVREAFGAETYARLQQVKRMYDPGNLLRMNQNPDRDHWVVER
jgi:FAD/FMN-containing dehydrogenase